MAGVVATAKSRSAGNTWLRPTLKDVARQASVARSTVSAILSKKTYCYASEETRQRVIDAARALNYQPNALSRGLLGQQTFTVALVLRDLMGPTLKSEHVASIQQLAQERGYRLLVAAHGNNPQLEETLIRSFLSQHVDGFIVEPAWAGWGEQNEMLYARMIEQGLPLVAIDPFVPINVAQVSVDRQHGASLQARHLIDIGRRRFAFMIEGADSPLGRAKVRGYRQTLDEAGIDPDAQIWIKVSFPAGRPVAEYPVLGTTLIDELLASGRPFDAIATSSDSLALGAMRALLTHGLRVPEDVAVAGFHDEMFGASLPVSLTTVRHPPDVDRIVFDLLMKQLEHVGDDNSNDGDGSGDVCAVPQRVVCTPSLVVRESTTTVRAADRPHDG